jgi:hypothetical protein
VRTLKLVNRLAAIAIVVLGCAGVCVDAATVPNGYTDSFFVRELAFPTAMDFAPDGRLFVLEQAGAVRVVKNAGGSAVRGRVPEAIQGFRRSIASPSH